MFYASANYAEGVYPKSKLKHTNLMLQSTSKDFCTFLGAFEKFQKATISFVISLSPHGTIWLPLEGLSLNLIFEEVSKNCRENSRHYNLTSIMDTLHEDQYTFLIGSRSFLLRERNISQKIYRENQTHILYSISFFRKSSLLWDYVEK